MQYFFLTDIVSPSPCFRDSLPGFDYTHGLLGLEPSTYEETIKMIEKSKYYIHKEIQVKHLNNTFLWILAPKK